MSIRTQVELDNTRTKLRMLEDDFQAAQRDSEEDEQLRGRTAESLDGLINPFKEEIADYEGHQPVRR